MKSKTRRQRIETVIDAVITVATIAVIVTALILAAYTIHTLL